MRRRRRRSLLLWRMFFLPLDFAWMVRRWFRWFSPDLVLVTETDFWFQFLRLLKREGHG